MSYTSGILLAILSALCWGGLSVARKSLGETMRTPSGVAWMSVFQIPCVALLYLAGQARQGRGDEVADLLFPVLTWPEPEYWSWMAASFVLNIGANWLMLRALQISPISLTAPYLAFTPIFTAILAIFVEDKIPNLWGWIGISIVCAGAFFLNGGDKDQGILAPLKALRDERGSLYSLIVAMLWSITPMLDKRATKLSDPIWHTGVLAAWVGVVFLAWVLVKDRGPNKLIKEFKGAPWWTIAAGALTVAALSCQLASYEGIEVSVMETIKRGVEVMVVMAAGYFMFDEKDIKRRFIAALVMACGVALTLLAG